MTAFHPSQRVTIQGQPVLVNVSTSQPGARCQQKHSPIAITTRVMSFSYTAHIAIVPNCQWDGAPGAFGQSAAMSRMHIELGKVIRQCCRMSANSISLKRASH